MNSNFSGQCVCIHGREWVLTKPQNVKLFTIISTSISRVGIRYFRYFEELWADFPHRKWRCQNSSAMKLHWECKRKQNGKWFEHSTMFLVKQLVFGRAFIIDIVLPINCSKFNCWHLFLKRMSLRSISVTFCCTLCFVVCENTLQPTFDMKMRKKNCVLRHEDSTYTESMWPKRIS